MKYNGKLGVVFDVNKNLDSILFPESVESFPDKQEWNNHYLWESRGNDHKMIPLTQKAIENLDEICKVFANNGYIGAKKSGKRKLTSIKYVLQTSLDGYEFVKG